MIEIIADGTGLVAESDETNNTLIVTLTCMAQPQPDLVIDNFEFNGSTIFYHITNNGQAAAGASVTRLRIDGNIVATSAVGPLGPGEGRWLSFNYAYACSAPGDMIEIIADGTGLANESDETNNTLTLILSCIAQPQPDLVIDNFEFNGSTIFYHITNNGQAAAGRQCHPAAHRWQHSGHWRSRPVRSRGRPVAEL